MGIGANFIIETLTSEGGSRRVGAKVVMTAAEVSACRGLGRGVGLLLGVGTARTQTLHQSPQKERSPATLF